MSDVTWVKFEWKLPGPSFEAPLPEGYGLRLAHPDEADIAARIAVDAYASDPVWLPMSPSIKKRMTARVIQAPDGAKARLSV